MTKVEWDAIDKSTTLKSNKSYSCNSSIKPSTSLTCTSKVGITNGSPAVQQRGNIGGLLGKKGSVGAA
jgi:hypothetical protein